MYDGLYMNFDQNGNIIYGRLQTDRPFQFKFQGSYNFKWGTSVGVNFNASSGVLQTTQVTYQGVPVDVFGRGDLGRSPMLSQTDLLLSHDVRLPKGMRASFQVNINNLFDQDTWTTIGTAAYRDALVLPATTGSSPSRCSSRRTGSTRSPCSRRASRRTRQPVVAARSTSCRAVTRVHARSVCSRRSRSKQSRM